MTQREQEKLIVRRALERGMDEDQIRELVVSFRQTRQPERQEQEQAPAREPGPVGAWNELTQVGEGVKGDIQRRGSDLADTALKAWEGEINPLQAGARFIGTTIGAGSDMLFRGLQASASVVAPESVEEELKAKVDRELQTPLGQKALEALQWGVDKWTSFAEENPEMAKDIAAVGNIASLFPVERALTQGPKAAVRGLQGLVRGTAKAGEKAAGTAYEAGRAGVKAAGAAAEDVAEGVASRLPGAAEKKAGIRAGLEAGSTEAQTAKYKLVDGKLVKDTTASEAVRQGLPERSVAGIKAFNEEERRIARQMLETRERQLVDDSVTARASDLPADEMLRVGGAVQDIRRAAGASLDDVAKGLKGQAVDLGEQLGSFREVLADEGVRFTDEGLDFAGSTFENITSTERIVRNVFTRLERIARSGDALEAHRLKKYIDENVHFGKRVEGLSGTTEAKLKDLRRNIDEALDTAFPDYDEVNTVYRETKEAVDGIRDFLGRDFDIGDKFAGTKLGTKLRALFNNTQGRAKMMQALETLETVASKYGIDQPVSVTKLARFADTLETALGSEAPGSILGQMEKAAKGAARLSAAGQQMAAGKPVAAAASAAMAGVEALQGKSQENLVRAMKGLLGEADDAVVKAALEPPDAKIPQILDPDGEPFERLKPGSLTPEDRAIETAAFEKISTKAGRKSALNWYKKHGKDAEGGKVVNTDEFRPYFKREGYNGNNAAAVHEPSSYLAKQMWMEGLEGGNPIAVATAGGPGSGKTSALKGIAEYNVMKEDAAVILDGTLANYNSTLGKIEQAADAGKAFHVHYVYRDPIDAWENGVIKRMISGGRVVRAETTAEATVGAWKTSKKLHEAGGDALVSAYDNSLGLGKQKQVTFDEMAAKADTIPETEELIARYEEIAKRYLDEGKITQEQYEALVERSSNP